MRFGKSIMALVADRGFRRNLGTGKSLSFVRAPMSPSAFSSLLNVWQSRPAEIRYPGATEAELQEFESEHGSIPNEYRLFLSAFGGGVVGAEWVDGIHQLRETHEKFKRESGANGWSLKDTFVIGWDGAGNPFGIHLPSGAVVVEDHNFGGVHEMAPSFEVFLREGLHPNGL